MKQHEALQKIEEIQHAPGGEKLLDSIRRGLSHSEVVLSKRLKLKFDLSEFLVIPGANDTPEQSIPIYSVTQTQIDTFVALSDFTKPEDDNILDQYAGDPEPWRVDTLTIDYGDGPSPNPAPLNATQQKVAYSVKSMKRDQKYTRTVIRTRRFLRGIMENHVCLRVTNDVLIEIDADRRLIPPGKKYPINVWVTPDLLGFSPTGTDNFRITSASTDPRITYEFHLNRQFLPYQGFSFILEV